MNLAQFFKRIETLTIDNSPTILTAFGITGVVGTAYLAAHTAFRVGKDVNAGHYEAGEHYDTRTMIRLYWKEFIPTAISGTLTIAAIVGSNKVNTRRATAMAAAYSISEKAFHEYKEKVIEKVGEKKERAYRDEIAQDRVDRNPPNDNTVIITDGGEVLCFDHFSGRYFKSSMEALKKAENEINHQIIHDGSACVGDLYDILGLPSTSISEEVGWNTDHLLDLVFSTVLSEDQRPCISIDFDLSPKRKYSHYAGE